jgi:hypothetical protein
VSWLRARRCRETIAHFDEAIFRKPRRQDETFADQHPREWATMESIMWMILSLIYRHCCRVYLMEMRRTRVGSPIWHLSPTARVLVTAGSRAPPGPTESRCWFEKGIFKMLAEKFMLYLEALIKSQQTHSDGSPKVISTSPHVPVKLLPAK